MTDALGLDSLPMLRGLGDAGVWPIRAAAPSGACEISLNILEIQLHTASDMFRLVGIALPFLLESLCMAMAVSCLSVVP